MEVCQIGDCRYPVVGVGVAPRHIPSDPSLGIAIDDARADQRASDGLPRAAN